jgi:ABC-2 type transport system permease protein
MGLFNAELRKLRTVWTTWILTFVGWVFVAFSAGFYTLESEISGAFTGTVDQVAAAIDQVGGNSVFVLVVALMLVTTEFRHGTIGRTLQLTPSRTRVLVAKGLAGAGYAAAFFVTSLVVVALFVGLRLAVADVSLQFGEPVWTAMWQGAAALVLTALFGVAIGALIRGQVVAITLSLVWIFVLEQMINAFWPEIGRWLPFQALNAIFLSDEVMATVPAGMIQPLEAGVALPLFLGYVLVAATAAAILMRVRDV